MNEETKVTENANFIDDLVSSDTELICADKFNVHNKLKNVILFFILLG